MPQLGETVTEGTVARWLKKPGDVIEKYEAFVEVSTDKVNADVPSPVAGTISASWIVGEGETVPTGAPIAVIDEVGAAQPSQAAPVTTSVAVAAPPVPPAAETCVQQRREYERRARLTGRSAFGARACDRRRHRARHRHQRARHRRRRHRRRVERNRTLPPVSPPAGVARSSVHIQGSASRSRCGAPPHRQTHGRVEADRAARMDQMVEVDVSDLWAWRTSAKDAASSASTASS